MESNRRNTSIHPSIYLSLQKIFKIIDWSGKSHLCSKLMLALTLMDWNSWSMNHHHVNAIYTLWLIRIFLILFTQTDKSKDKWTKEGIRQTFQILIAFSKKRNDGKTLVRMAIFFLVPNDEKVRRIASELIFKVWVVWKLRERERKRFYILLKCRFRES